MPVRQRQEIQEVLRSVKKPLFAFDCWGSKLSLSVPIQA